MKYFKNTELARLYHVSEKSVRNWVQAAQDGKLDLQLYEEDGRFHIANITKNTALMEDLVKKGKKYKNTRGFKMIFPKKEFYKVYNQKQILDIISNLTIHHEIPREYCYFKGGATAWDNFTTRLDHEPEVNILKSTQQTLGIVTSNFDYFLGDIKRINVVDIGPGNGLPVRPTLEFLIERGLINRYIALDVSPDMLEITKKNIRAWFGNKIKFEGYIRDVSFERFGDLLAADYTDDADIANLVLFLGGTLNNFRDPSQGLQTISNSLTLDDLFVYSGYLDTPETRRYFDFNAAEGKLKIPHMITTVPELLNIDESLYEVEQLFDEISMARSISIRPQKDLRIMFEVANGVRHVELRKDEPILLWRHWHYSAINSLRLFDEKGFDLVGACKSRNNEYFLSISKIKTSTG